MSTAITEVQTAVAEFDRVAAGIAALKEKFGGIVYDVAVSKGMEAAKEARAAIREPRYEIERVRKEAKAPILKLGKELDDRAKAITAEILAIEAPIDQQIKSEEARKETEKQAKIAAELKRVADLQERVVYLNGSPNLTSLDDPTLIAEHISDLQGEIVDESFQEYRERGAAAKATGIARLQALHAAAVERVAEAERVKAERAELAERDRIAQEALKAERAEQERVAAQERARIAEDERLAKVARDAETAHHNEQLRLQREEADRQARERQAVIDAENARVAAANRAEAERLAIEQQKLDRAREAERLAQAAEEAKRAEQARIASLKRPDDEELMDVIAVYYNVPRSKAVEWVLAIDFSNKELAAA